ncbi:alpha/beta hydrolase [Rhizobium sullae]|uniref:alpha/beta hydrolase n=1 Tax=Rhizobium sullae TaxID=50338 RepID=UPI00117A7CDD|nr:prolyl oligopeptidase family serine peptidase [Rhizobium sullae]
MTERLTLQGFEYHTFGTLERDSRPIVVFHKTGGDEGELVPLANTVAPGTAVVGLRGQVVEDSKLRFFKRLGAGRFDEADLATRADDLNEFLRQFISTHRVRPPVALGLSNGANIITAALYRGDPPLSAAVLLRPAIPFRNATPASIGGTKVLVVGGMSDETVKPDEILRLTDALRAAGARVDLTMIAAAGHRLVTGDEAAIQGWLKMI